MMWRRKPRRIDEENTEAALEENRSVRTSRLEPDGNIRKAGRADGDLTQGDEGIDDPHRV